MRALVRFGALFALTELLAIGGPLAVAIHLAPESQTSSPDQLTTAQFRLVRAGLGLIEGVHASVKTFEAEDGENVQLLMAHFRSPDDARKALQNLKDHATKVTRQDASDESGKVVSDRWVLTLPAKEQKTTTAIVVIAGSDFREIVSYSAQAAFAFETFTKSRPH
jgi:hypothetical protein